MNKERLRENDRKNNNGENGTIAIGEQFRRWEVDAK